MKLTNQEIDFLKLINRSPSDEHGWRQVSNLLWDFVIEFPKRELIEIDELQKRVRFSPRGKVLVEYI